MESRVAAPPGDTSRSFVGDIERGLRRNTALFLAMLGVLVILAALAGYKLAEYIYVDPRRLWQLDTAVVLLCSLAALVALRRIAKEYRGLYRFWSSENARRMAAERDLQVNQVRLQETVAKLGEANRLLERTFSSVSFLVAYLDTGFNFRWVNPAYADADGRSPEFFVGKNHFDLYPDQENLAIFSHVVETGEPFVTVEKPFEYAENPERGATYWDWSCHPVKNAKGEVEGVALCLIDRTSAVKAREEIRLAAEEWSLTFNAMRDAVSIHGRDMVILKANQAFADMTGTSADQLVGRHCYEVVHGLDRPWDDCPASQVLRHHAAATSDYFEPRLKRWLSVSASPVRDSGKDSVKVVHVVRDITAQRAAEEHLRQAQKMEAVGRLAGGVAHDFNNLLSVILGFSQMLIEDAPGWEKARPDLQEIHQAATRAAALTRQLLAFSRQQVLQPRVVDLNEVVTGMEKMLHRLIGEDIDLQIVEGGAGSRALVDPGQIEQVLMNLAINARDAMPDGGRLVMELSRVDLDEEFARDRAGIPPGAYIMLSVSDTGVGMDEATTRRIFEPFFTTKEMGKGTGLGLSTVFGIVRQSRGGICVASEPGKGTTLPDLLPARGRRRRADGAHRRRIRDVPGIRNDPAGRRR